MFQRALQIYGHVMLAINVEDFRYLATQYLSTDLADKLTNLVSEASLAKRNSGQIAEKKADLDLNKFADVIKDKLRNELKESNEKVTPDYKLKRFNTVHNEYNEQLLRKSVTKTTPGPVYVKDELEDLLQINKEAHSNNGNRKIGYATNRLAERDEDIVSQEAIRPISNQGETRDKIDYSETKLGEWRYNHVIPKEPVTMKNLKTGNANADNYDESNTAYDEFKKYELLGEAENLKQVQYVYETHLLGRKDRNKNRRPDIENNANIGTGILLGLNNQHNNEQNVKDLRVDNQDTLDDQVRVDDQDTLDQYILGTNQKDSPKRKPHKEIIEEIYTHKREPLGSLNEIGKDHSSIFEKQFLGSKYKNKHESILTKQDDEILPRDEERPKTEASINNSVKGKNQEVEEHVKFETHFLGSTEKETDQIQPIEENEMYEKYPLGSSIETNTKKEVGHRSKEDSEEKIREVKKIVIEDENKNNGKQSSNNELLLKRDKKRYLRFKGPKKNEDNSKKGPLKRFPFHRLKYSDENKSIAVKLKPKDFLKDSKEIKAHPVEQHVKFTKKMDIDTNKSHKKPIEENEMYEKFSLGSENEMSDNRKAKQQAKDSNEFKKSILGSTIKLHFESTSKKGADYKPSNKERKKEQSLLRTKRYGSSNVSKYCKENPNSERCVTEETTTKSALKADVSVPDFKNVKLGSKKGKYSDHSVEVKDDQVNKNDNYHLQPEKKNNRKKKPQKPIEQNDMYEKYELGRDTKNDNDRKVKKHEDDHEVTEAKSDTKNKFNRNIGRNKNKEASNNEVTERLVKNKKRYKHFGVPNKYKQSKSEQTKSKNKKVPIEDYADDPRPDFKEVKPESIKAKTGSMLGDSVEGKGKGKRTKKFTMKGTVVPKRDFYKLSSPNYYKDLPRVVDKYDFDEPLPERDRERDKVKYLKREPSRVNRKLKLPRYERT